MGAIIIGYPKLMGAKEIYKSCHLNPTISSYLGVGNGGQIVNKGQSAIQLIALFNISVIIDLSLKISERRCFV